MSRRTQEEIKKESHIYFTQFDKDCNGSISFDEFIQFFYWKFKIERYSEAINNMINDIFTLVDGQGLLNKKDEKLNEDEFYRMYKFLPIEINDPKIDIFNVIYNMADTDGDGVVSRKEMVQFLKKILEVYNKKEVERMIERLDTNNDNILQQEEFIQIYNEDDEDDE